MDRTLRPAMQDLYKDLEERLQELSNLSSVSNLLVRHVLALHGDGRALSRHSSRPEDCGGCRPGMSWSCCRQVSPAAAVSISNLQSGRAGLHVLSTALVDFLQAPLSLVASRRQPWPACCMTRQAAAEARSTLAGSVCESFDWCVIPLLATKYPGSARWSIGSHTWHQNTGVSLYAARWLTCGPAAVLQRTDAELGRLLQGLGKQQDSLQPLQTAVLREANR